MMFALLNQSEEYRSTRKKGRAQKQNMVSQEQKLTYKKEISNIYILKNLLETVNPTMHMITNIHTQ